MRKRVLLFDLDGTLTDPGEGITNAVAFALEKYGVRVADKRELYPYIGPPLTESFQKLHGMTPERAVQALADYREYFSERGIFENMPYPGVTDTLGCLRREGYTLAVATSKPEEFTHRILERFGLAEYFTLVAGNTLDESRPTKGAVIAHVREMLPEVPPEDMLMIGDREYDVRGAAEHGIAAVGVLFGYGTREELENAGAAAVAADFGELTQAIRRLLPLE